MSNPALDCIMTRRSIRSFDERRIPREDMQLIINAACNAPSARNQQKWHFTIIRDKNAIAELAGAISEKLGLGSGYDFYKPDTFVICTAPRDYTFGAEDCACALENMFLSAHALGIGSVWINYLRSICND